MNMDVYGFGKHVHKAANYVNIECLAYVQKNGCPLDQGTIEKSFKCSHLESFKFLREHGCASNRTLGKKYTLITALNVFMW